MVVTIIEPNSIYHSALSSLYGPSKIPSWFLMKLRLTLRLTTKNSILKLMNWMPHTPLTVLMTTSWKFVGLLKNSEKAPMINSTNTLTLPMTPATNSPRKDSQLWSVIH